MCVSLFTLTFLYFLDLKFCVCGVNPIANFLYFDERKRRKEENKSNNKQKEKKCTANEYKLMIYEKTQEYENINTYRTIKMMMERKNSKKEPTINISLACAASSYPQIHRLFEKQKTSSPAKRFR